MNTNTEIEGRFIQNEQERKFIDGIRSLDISQRMRVLEFSRLLTERREDPNMRRLIERVNSDDANALELLRRFRDGSISSDELLAAA